LPKRGKSKGNNDDRSRPGNAREVFWFGQPRIRNREKISGLESYMRQGFELMNAKIDAVDQKIEHKIEFLQEGLFTPDEKKSLFDTVKLVNDRLADNGVRRMDITLTRPEYDMLMESVRLPNRFLKPEMIEVE
jgi:hypothetical protein